eukprot:5007672-Pyramimonas_sp.AAC.1
MSVGGACLSASAPSPPGSARGAPYGGSRKHAQRLEYGEGSRAAFVELALAGVMSGQQLFDTSAKVPRVARVAWHTSKSSQRNRGNHYMEQSVLVCVDG